MITLRIVYIFHIAKFLLILSLMLKVRFPFVFFCSWPKCEISCRPQIKLLKYIYACCKMHKILSLIMIFDIHKVASSKISVSWNVTLHCLVARRHQPNELSDVTFQNIVKSRNCFLLASHRFWKFWLRNPPTYSYYKSYLPLPFLSSVCTALSSSNRPYFLLFIYVFWYFSFKK